MKNPPRDPQVDPDLPILQIPLRATDGGPDVLASLLPGGWGAFMAGRKIEASQLRAIPQNTIAELARALRVEPSEDFILAVHEMIIAYGIMIIKGWHSPRWFIRFYDDLLRDRSATIARYADDPWVRMTIKNLSRQLNLTNYIDLLNAGDHFTRIVHLAREDMRQLNRRGIDGTHPVPLFWMHVLKTARRFGCDDLQLPARDSSRGGPKTTPLYEFANLMRKLLVTQARVLLGPDTTHARLTKLEPMSKKTLIATLERAKQALGRETSNSPS
jgi:hypothetical protein